MDHDRFEVQLNRRNVCTLGKIIRIKIPRCSQQMISFDHHPITNELLCFDQKRLLLLFWKYFYSIVEAQQMHLVRFKGSSVDDKSFHEKIKVILSMVVVDIQG